MKLTSKRIWLCIAMLGCIILLLLYQWDFTRSVLQLQIMSNYNNTTNALHKQKEMKYILEWTSPNHWPLKYWGPGQNEYIRRKCKINNCYVTANRSFFPNTSQFDAVVYNAMEMWSHTFIPGPSERSPHQKYIFVSVESSEYYPICNRRYDGYFNWTWTYRLDSDEPYGYITIRNIAGDIIGPNQIMHWMKLDSMQPIDTKTKKMLEKKNKTAAWFVSNCNSLSKREKIVRRLQRQLSKYGLEIDIFGACHWASKQCPLAKMKECLKLIQEEYYFYLSFENSFSEDYVTEKLLTALQNYAVPVVFGGANYTRFMPDGIYLHARKLKVSDLAKQMNDIIKDKDRYYNFFKWRNHYSYHDREESPDSDDQCITCAMLNDENLVKKETVYKDFRSWWNVPWKCFE
ncbi:alpha-(1,3)-fucosyltransferase C-like [Cydia pomonella]|uniref:alpha-(1,3)-fucosyltransferase C-like n=1 Tax=Cydia pomonella TaxID=82600 RepID=UPI002ADE732C|nr:alpha-(1,3)-fucosyltransferase C-like [Cydia pomonella]